ncbi:hypothetical protein GZL_05731 [Streptomyces sp. 769]|nr:hypothetical protein GZL_05731 [Streptomyces sp. 769]
MDNSVTHEGTGGAPSAARPRPSPRPPDRQTPEATA